MSEWTWCIEDPADQARGERQEADDPGHEQKSEETAESAPWPTAASAHVELQTTIDDDLPLLDVDPVRIREVVGNLVANALRHTPAGGRIGVQVRLAHADGKPRPQVIEITVRDTGSGIDPELLPHVFDRFARGAGSTGSGLGLSIARGLVELHGGTIEASSPPGSGAEIRIRLPIEPIKA